MLHSRTPTATATSRSAARSGSATRWRSRRRSTHRTTDLQDGARVGEQQGHGCGSAGTARPSTTASRASCGTTRCASGPTPSARRRRAAMASWPDNTLTYLHGTGAVSLPMRGRLTGYVAVRPGPQQRRTCCPSPSTPRIAPPPPLARTTAEAESQMTIAQFTFAMRPAPGLFAQRALSLQRRRRADADLRSSRAARCPTTPTCRASTCVVGVSQRQALDVRRRRRAFDLVPLHVAEGRLQQPRLRLHAPHLGDARTKNVFRVSVDTTGNQLLQLRALYENRQRTGDDFEAEALAARRRALRHAALRHRRSQPQSLHAASATPALTSAFGLTASAGVGRDEYTDSDHGLQFFDSDQYSVGVNIAPDDRYNVLRQLRAGRTTRRSSARATPATRPSRPTRARDWTTDYTGKVNFFEASFDINDVIERTLIRLTGRLEQVERHVSLRPRDRIAARRAGTAAAGEERAVARRDRS